MEQIIFPIRINRYLALKGLGTRRGIDELIKKRRITINGRIVLLGDMVRKEDVVEVTKTKHDHDKKLYYYAYYKPVGIVTPQQGERSHALISDKKLFSVGRLDKDSSGLMILTNDGRITDRLLNPAHEHEKEYIVEVDKKLTPHVLRILQQGIMIEGYRTKPSKTIFINDKTFRIILGEGKKHQIRRMVVAMGMQVRSLKRVRVMNILLGKLQIGEMREIKGEELADFLKALGLIS